MGNDISSFCNCTDNKLLAKYEHVTKPVNTPTNAEKSENKLSLHKSLERVKQKYESSNDLRASRKRMPTMTDIQEDEQKDSNEPQTISYEDGGMYVGQIADGLRNGMGIYTKNGSTYDGEYMNDMMNGFGKYEDQDFIYEGSFLDDKKHGHGIEVNKAGTYRYEGQWKDNFKNGIGKELLPDKSRYEGTYINGKKSGKGKLYLSNGSIYEGELQNDKLEGHGVLKWSEEKIYEGQWHNNCLSGLGKFKNKNKLYKGILSLTLGYFMNDRKHGYGINYDLINNTLIIGQWEENLIQGLSIYMSQSVEQIWQMKDNKLIKKVTDGSEMNKYKSTEEYRKLHDFYDFISNI
jgi:hypothetical protein